MSWTSAEQPSSRGGDDETARLHWFVEHGYLTQPEAEARLQLLQYERRRWAYLQRQEQSRRREVSQRAKAS